MRAVDWDQRDAEAPYHVERALLIAPRVGTTEFHRRTGESFATAAPDAALIALATSALKEQALEPTGDLILIRHRSGDRGLPADDGHAAYRFAIDLTDSPRGIHGGLLLFADSAGRVTGWRAEAGAMTIWAGTSPELTELVPGAPERLTLLGQARARNAI